MSSVALSLTEPDTTRLLRETVAAVCKPYGHEYFVRQCRERQNPRELWQALGEAGLLGVAIPEEHGGGGGGIADLAVVTEEAAASGVPLMLLALSPAVCAATLVAHGSEEQKQRWLPGLASGESVMAFAITEPDAGSNSHNIATTAVRTDDGWVLRGQKYYVSHVDNAQAILVVARVVADDDTAGLSLFVVDVDAPGLTRAEIEVEMVSPERQFTLWFDDVRIPADAVVGRPGGGLAVLFTGLNPERIGSAALLTGIARYALGKAARYATQRQVWGVPIGAHQAVAHPLARAAVQTELARLMTAKAAALYDAGLDAAEAANMAKFAASEAASAALDAAIQTHGGNGMATEYGLATLLALVRLFRIAPVSTEMVLNHIARRTLGLPKSY
ncbi:acyl-CoA dehydrogenase family protein [Micromonospora sonneratiae]|uniref:Acyl-CoA dehydrogenase family protein n=1 Tax=Micromonospora sonneratiae TaxID=1184706 RepID=A0ABW3Y815_9ACTN